MDSPRRYVVDLSEADRFGEDQIGGKAANLARLCREGLKIPEGFCLNVLAYERFLEANRLTDVIASELGRKPLDSMRWEELWDAALRIRSLFSKGELPEGLLDELAAALESLGPDEEMAVRSSAPGEDSVNRSFAGVHESYVGVRGLDAVCEKIRQVWASLWSDAALLYRRELNLDPRRSRMAVVIQRLVRRNRSGVAFGRDPRDLSKEQAIIEAVPGLCSDLVDGVTDPQRWTLDRITGKILSSPETTPLLEDADLQTLLHTLLSLEELMGWAADVEWTGRRERLTLLQARPITRASMDTDDQRSWYLSLSPSSPRMKTLCDEVVNELIPQLEKDGTRLSEEGLENLTSAQLMEKLNERAGLLQKWEKIYWEKFIPFAHGVRQFGRYYNDVMKPDDPYEFVELLETEKMLAVSRNDALERLSRMVRKSEALTNELKKAVKNTSGGGVQLEMLEQIDEGRMFLREYHFFLAEHGDVAFQKTYLRKRPDLILKNILSLAQAPEDSERKRDRLNEKEQRAAQLEQDFFQSADDHSEAMDLLRIARLSWRLRDDDNILIGRLEGQLLRAIDLGRARLESSVTEIEIREQLSELLGGLEKKESKIRSSSQEKPAPAAGETPRQLVGQPAAPGLGKGKARCIRTPDDLGEFAVGEILVCDAIQPTMTHLVPLAAGVVERRGGMLIHGAIIARELGIPCVNGVSEALVSLQSGDLLTLDGYLGIVTVGEPILDLESLSQSFRN